jgi:uncharacterized membrane protein YphA (DoxX/SURF4 family)
MEPVTMPEPFFNKARILRLVCWAAAAWIAWELLFYEQFKLTGDAGSIDGVFQPLANWFGIPAHEKPIRLGVGIMEIIAAVLVLFPRTRVPGAALTLGLMSGAIFFTRWTFDIPPVLRPVIGSHTFFAAAFSTRLFL